MFWKRQKEHFELSSIGRLGPLAPPKTKEYKTIATLLDDAERWRNVGDKELENKTWAMISEKASMYSDGYREKYENEFVQTSCGIIKPDFPSDRIEDGSNG